MAPSSYKIKLSKKVIKNIIQSLNSLSWADAFTESIKEMKTDYEKS